MTKEMGVSDVQSALAGHGIEVVRMPADTSTALLAAAALDTTVASIVKSLLFMSDGAPVLVLASGDRKVDTESVRQEMGAERVRLARPSEVLEVTGYSVGGVPPLAHRHTFPVLMDRMLLAHPTVYAAAGALNAIFPVEPSRLCEIARARVVDICT